GTVRVEGPQARARLQATLTNDLGRIIPGRAQYTHLLAETDASVLDDIIVWWIDDERFDVMPNASNTDRVRAAIGGEDVTAERAVVAVQGPRARARLATVAADAAAVGRFCVGSFVWEGRPAVAAGTGYTGEDGVECALPADVAPSFWEALLDAGVAPAGLGARDTLRLEAALPLHGHELGPGITPLQAGLGWVVSWTKPEGFRGREALERERRAGPSRRLVGVSTEGRQPPRAGATLCCDGTPIGTVTSGNFSPVLGHGIALAFAPPGIEPGLPVRLEQRGRHLAGRIAALPFVAKKKG
ncbi:MAG: glycine cleavage T C-terminal barrel domain-containing protein, partial [Acidimicrobiales bacterium]